MLISTVWATVLLAVGFSLTIAGLVWVVRDTSAAARNGDLLLRQITAFVAEERKENEEGSKGLQGWMDREPERTERRKRRWATVSMTDGHDTLGLLAQIQQGRDSGAKAPKVSLAVTGAGLLLSTIASVLSLPWKT
jgi:hypothetical protein